MNRNVNEMKKLKVFVFLILELFYIYSCIQINKIDNFMHLEN